MRTLARLVVISLAIAAPPHAARAGASCPTDTLWAQSKFEVFGGVITHAARIDTTFLDGCGRAVARYDLAGGTFTSEIDFTCSGWTTTTAWDVYTVVGLPAGTPVSLEAVLDADAQMVSVPGQYPDISASARLSSGSQAVVLSAVTLPQQAELTLPLAQVAGTPFALRVALRTGTNVSGGHARIDATLRFRSLPGGANLVSCQGYEQTPVPVRPASWGSLKATYR